MISIDKTAAEAAAEPVKDEAKKAAASGPFDGVGEFFAGVGEFIGSIGDAIGDFDFDFDL